MTYGTLPKYLGVKIDPMGKIDIPWKKWNEWLTNLAKSPLKPEQKVFGLKNTIIPKMIHQLRLANIGFCRLKQLNRDLKKWFKQVLHLPDTCYFFLSLSVDIETNPGPGRSVSTGTPETRYTDNFFSFCNWNLNTLEKQTSLHKSAGSHT